VARHFAQKYTYEKLKKCLNFTAPAPLDVALAVVISHAACLSCLPINQQKSAT